MAIKLTSRIRKKWPTCSVVLTRRSRVGLWSRLVPSVSRCKSEHSWSEFLVLVHEESVPCCETVFCSHMSGNTESVFCLNLIDTFLLCL